MNIEYNAKPDEAIAKLAEAQHERYEQERGVFFGFTPFQLVAREKGEITGVLSGYAVYREIYVDSLAVFQGCRGQGIGKQLLEEAEGLFPDREIDYIHLVTNGFQAPGFYKKSIPGELISEADYYGYKGLFCSCTGPASGNPRQ